MMIAALVERAAWIASTSSPSWLVCIDTIASSRAFAAIVAAAT
jgi:hypothetical protein